MKNFLFGLKKLTFVGEQNRQDGMSHIILARELFIMEANHSSKQILGASKNGFSKALCSIL